MELRDKQRLRLKSKTRGTYISLDNMKMRKRNCMNQDTVEKNRSTGHQCEEEAGKTAKKER